MIGKAALQDTEAPSGYLSPVVYPSKIADLRGNASAVMATEGQTPIVNEVPRTETYGGGGTGWTTPVTHWTLPIRIRPENMGIYHVLGVAGT